MQEEIITHYLDRKINKENPNEKSGDSDEETLDDYLNKK